MSSPADSVSASAVRPIKKLMAANRGEIAVRIFRAATELGLRTVAVFAHEDRFGIHRYKADEAYQVGQGKGPVAPYLDIDGIVAVAKATRRRRRAPRLWVPLRRMPPLPAPVEAAGITLVGPRPELLEMMGDKTAARALAKNIKVPVLPGTEEPVTDRGEALKLAKEIGFPLIIKARLRRRRARHARRAQGGGSRGAARRGAGRGRAAFGNPAVFLEKYISARQAHRGADARRQARQRHPPLRARLLRAAPPPEGRRGGAPLRPAQEHHQASSATPPPGLRASSETTTTPARSSSSTISSVTSGFFIEMNPRIQVEHTVTEVVTGLDLVRAQILIAQGHSLHSAEVGMPQQADVPCNGYAIQCRITTEDPRTSSCPDYGRIMAYRSPGGLGIRLDGGMGYAGAVITPFYDSMLVKLISSGTSFDAALHSARIARSPEFRDPRRQDQHPVPGKRSSAHPALPRPARRRPR